MESNQKHKVAIITGGGSGIGRAAAIALGRSGYKLALLGRREDKLHETSSIIADCQVLCIPTDISDQESVQSAFRRVVLKFGRLDVLFNNAGIGAPAVTIDELSVSDWQNCISVNLTGTFLCARLAFRIMKTQRPIGGRIINNGSVSAHSPRPKTVAYTATKHAITGLTKSLSLDGRPYDITISQLDIGNAETTMTLKFPDGTEQASGQIAIEPVFDVKRCGDAVAFIANLPLDTNVQFMTIMATKMPFIGRG